VHRTAAPCTIDLTVLAVGTRGGGALEVGLEHTKADGRAWASLAARRVHARPILAQLRAGEVIREHQESNSISKTKSFHTSVVLYVDFCRQSRFA
jgi:hypothetical protein